MLFIGDIIVERGDSTMSDIFETAIVEKRNVLNELRANNLTLQELRFFSIYLSKINPYDTTTRNVKFKLSDFQKIMDFKTLNIVQIKAAVDSLLTKIVHIPKKSGGYTAFQLFKECEIDKDSSGEWYVSIDAHDKALPLMFDFKDRYFKYELWNALRLRSANQIRMYEILKQYENIGRRELSVSDLRELLGITPNEYQRWDRFRDRVLDSCQQALKETTDICYTYERGKTGAGGKWLTIIFHISKNKDYVDQLTLFEFMEQSGGATAEPLEQEPQQLELCNTRKSDNIDFYAGACENEFNSTEIESLMAIINSMQLPAHDMGTLFAKYHFLLEQYTRFKAIAERTTIANRYSYFYTMIRSERDKQMAGDTE